VRVGAADGGAGVDALSGTTTRRETESPAPATGCRVCEQPAMQRPTAIRAIVFPNTVFLLFFPQKRTPQCPGCCDPTSSSREDLPRPFGPVVAVGWLAALAAGAVAGATAGGQRRGEICGTQTCNARTQNSRADFAPKHLTMNVADFGGRLWRASDLQLSPRAEMPSHPNARRAILPSAAGTCNFRL